MIIWEALLKDRQSQAPNSYIMQTHLIIHKVEAIVNKVLQSNLTLAIIKDQAKRANDNICFMC